MFLKNKNIIFKIKRSKVTDYAALMCRLPQWWLLSVSFQQPRIQSSFLLLLSLFATMDPVQLWRNVYLILRFFVYLLYRGSYMSAHVLLNLLNELGKRDQMRGLPSILSLFRNELNKFNNTRARILDSIYHMTNTLESHFWRKNVMILSSCTQRCYGRNNVSRKSINH